MLVVCTNIQDDVTNILVFGTSYILNGSKTILDVGTEILVVNTFINLSRSRWLY